MVRSASDPCKTNHHSVFELLAKFLVLRFTLKSSLVVTSLEIVVAMAFAVHVGRVFHTLLAPFTFTFDAELALLFPPSASASLGGWPRSVRLADSVRV